MLGDRALETDSAQHSSIELRRSGRRWAIVVHPTVDKESGVKVAVCKVLVDHFHACEASEGDGWSLRRIDHEWRHLRAPVGGHEVRSHSRYDGERFSPCDVYYCARCGMERTCFLTSDSLHARDRGIYSHAHYRLLVHTVDGFLVCDHTWFA